MLNVIKPNRENLETIASSRSLSLPLSPVLFGSPTLPHSLPLFLFNSQYFTVPNLSLYHFYILLSLSIYHSLLITLPSDLFSFLLISPSFLTDDIEGTQGALCAVDGGRSLFMKHSWSSSCFVLVCFLFLCFFAVPSLMMVQCTVSAILSQWRGFVSLLLSLFLLLSFPLSLHSLFPSPSIFLCLPPSLSLSLSLPFSLSFSPSLPLSLFQGYAPLPRERAHSSSHFGTALALNDFPM